VGRVAHEHVELRLWANPWPRRHIESGRHQVCDEKTQLTPSTDARLRYLARMKFACCSGLAAVSLVAACGSSGGAASNASPSEAGTDASASTYIPYAPDASLAPVTGLTANAWVWTPVTGTMCRDGSQTGFAVNLASPPSNNLVIYLEGGGACVDEFFCSPLASPTTFGESQFSSWQGDATGDANSGIFNRGDTANPVAGWNFVYIPYCTGDIFTGNRTNVTVPKVSMVQQFVGYTDVGLDLDRIVPTFPGVQKVLLTGISAGGFGASANYVQTARHFGSTPVYLLDDSGPPMEAPYLAECMQSQFASLWGMDGALADCGSDCSNPDSYFVDFAKHLGKAYPTVPFGLIESSQDAVISLFFGYGNPGNCVGSDLPGASVPGATFTEGLQVTEEQLAGTSNFGSFILGGSRNMQHTSLGSSSTFDGDTTNVTASLLVPDGGTDEDAGTIALTTWITTLVNDGKVSNVGP